MSMKFAIVISVFVAAGIFQDASSIQPSEALRLAVMRLTSDTTSTIQRLTRLKNDAPFDLSTKLTNLKINQMQNVNNAVNGALTEIQSQVAKAKAGGHAGGDRCYDDAKASLRSTSLKAFTNLDECKKTAASSMNSVVNSIDAYISSGNQITSELQGFGLNCYSYSPFTPIPNTCIVKLAELGTAVRNLQAQYSSLQDSVQRVTNSAVVSANGCMNGIMSTMFSEVTGARLAADKCLSTA